jgi:hypothetical protein
MRSDIYISHVTGRCSVCGAPILDSGYDDPEDWEHDFATGERDADWDNYFYYKNPAHLKISGPAYKRNPR